MLAATIVSMLKAARRRARTGVERAGARYIYGAPVGPPIFIVGCGHSGTTLLLAMLSAQPRIFAVPYETLFLARGSAAIRRFIAEFNRATSADGKQRWVEKSPSHILHLDKLLRIFGDARVILMLRDGRDVATSLRDRTGDFRAGIRRWVSDNRAGKQFWSHEAVLVVKYEDLVAAAEPTLRSICAFLDEAFDESMLRHHETGFRFLGAVDGVEEVRDRILSMTERPASAAGENHRFYRSWQAKQPLFDGRNRWRSALSPEECALFEEIGGEMLRMCGYELNSEWLDVDSDS